MLAIVLLYFYNLKTKGGLYIMAYKINDGCIGCGACIECGACAGSCPTGSIELDA